jgi:hypothetical protein
MHLNTKFLICEDNSPTDEFYTSIDHNCPDLIIRGTSTRYTHPHPHSQ